MNTGVTHGIRLDIAYAVGLFVETFIYGIYFCLFFAALPAMAKRERLIQSPGRTSAWIFLVVTILLFLVATCHLLVSVHRMIRGTVLRENPLGPVAYILDRTQWTFLANIILLCIMTWLGDALVIYRCYIVWNHNKWLVAFPIALLLCSMTLSTYVLYWFTHPLAIPPFDGFRVFNCIYVLAFAENFIATSLIILKIYLQHRELMKTGVVDPGSSSLSLIRVVRIIIESAMIYTIELLVLIIFFFLANNLQFIVVAAIVPSIGITFVLIAIRVHKAKQPKHTCISNDLMDNSRSSWLDDVNGGMQFSQPENVPIPTTLNVDERSMSSSTSAGQGMEAKEKGLPLTNIGIAT